jgi:hypothetical protein
MPSANGAGCGVGDVVARVGKTDTDPGYPAFLKLLSVWLDSSSTSYTPAFASSTILVMIRSARSGSVAPIAPRTF